VKTGFYELIQGIHKRGSDKSLLAHGELICSLNTTALLATSPSDYRATTNFLEADSGSCSFWGWDAEVGHPPVCVMLPLRCSPCSRPASLAG